MMTPQPPETAPKDRPILGCFGYPWWQVATWNPAMGEWVTAQIEGNVYEGQDDPGWITEYEQDNALRCWLPMPELPELPKLRARQ